MTSLLLVGNPSVIHVGGHLLQAAQELGLPVRLADARKAYQAGWLQRQICWRWLGHRPACLNTFSREVVVLCRQLRPTWLLTTGLAPVHAAALGDIRRLGVVCLNYLTDDPWNPRHRARWFQKALPLYDRIFSPRYANLDDLRRLGCPAVEYLPFAYNPKVHWPEQPTTAEAEDLASDILFVGGADRDRVPLLAALLRAGMKVALYGGYWDRYRETRAWARGHADPTTLRKATAAAKVALCLVRRANRDGHVMRTFEIAAQRGCMLAEDTPEHRRLLGLDGDTVRYFSGADQLVERARWLLDHAEERHRLARALHQRIAGSSNTYRDRLAMMLSLSCR